MGDSKLKEGSRRERRRMVRRSGHESIGSGCCEGAGMVVKGHENSRESGRWWGIVYRVGRIGGQADNT